MTVGCGDEIHERRVQDGEGGVVGHTLCAYSAAGIEIGSRSISSLLLGARRTVALGSAAAASACFVHASAAAARSAASRSPLARSASTFMSSTIAVMLSREPISRQYSISRFEIWPGSVTPSRYAARTKAHACSFVHTSHTPSHARITNSSASWRACTRESGTQLTSCFSGGSSAFAL